MKAEAHRVGRPTFALMPLRKTEQQPAWLLLEDGTLLTGRSFGAPGTQGGELCFNTGMTGYQEVFTDPSYTGQILIMNNAYIGNYGVRQSDVESDQVRIRGLVCRNISERYSRMQADNSLEEYLTGRGIVALQQVDTRALVQHIRSKGAMNAILSTEMSEVHQLRAALEKVPQMAGLDLSEEASTHVTYSLGAETAANRIAVLDFGVKRSMLDLLAAHDAFVQVFPARTNMDTLLAFRPNGVFISNGPGDPASMDYAAETIRQLIATGTPLFGVCLGHQLLARANNIPTFKMHHGHRGLNHPVKNLVTGLSEITTQNHGFGVDAAAVAASEDVETTHINLNDGSIEGIRMLNRPAFSVQYHPESTPGPHDSRYLFEDFFKMITEARS